MRNLFIIISILSFLNCGKDLSSHKEKFFDPQKLPLLSLADVNNFWHDDSVKHTSFMDGIFNDHPGFLGGVRYSGDKKGVAVSVFKSQADAIDAMELLRNNVAAIIIEGGKHELISGKWWHTKSPSNAVFVNQWNIIIEVDYCYPAYEEIPSILIETVAEIARRIEALSN